MTPSRLGLLVGILVVLSGVWSSADAFRCDQRLVVTGDTPAEVVLKCGEPTAVATWQETLLVEADPRIPHRHANKQRFVDNRMMQVIEIEEWTYNRGPHNLIYLLRFRAGRLADVQTRGYGY